MKRDLELYYRDILESIDLIERYVGKGDYPKFHRDVKLVDSVIRRIEIIGEAVNQIPESVKKNYPNVFWDFYVKSRNFLIHVYFGVNHLRVWGMIKNRLPILKGVIKKLLKEKNGRED